ncbi:MAG: anthranilate phosphoribosyltransferase [Mariprofundaceae bacterium]|nr:anthranilate phosphoribosyltransferase [Mariprofundaceae bacterium]
MSTVIQACLKQLQQGEVLSQTQAQQAFEVIMQGQASDAQIGGFLMALSIFGETSDVLTGAAKAMRAASSQVFPNQQALLDTCGTGGDGASTFNVSTTVALVVAACGQPVAKHGNRAISSRSGSADVLQASGVNLDLTPQQVAQCIDDIGIGFLFAQNHHPAMRHAIGTRKELGVRTIFNLLGPLTNPANADYQVLGVYSKDKLMMVAQTLLDLGIKRALVVHGRDGMDEITTTTITDAVMVEQGQPLRAFEIDPHAFGMPYGQTKDLAGGGPKENLAIMHAILAGEPGAGRDIVLLNTAAALWVCGKADGISQGLSQAAKAIDDHHAIHLLRSLITKTQQANQ